MVPTSPCSPRPRPPPCSWPSGSPPVEGGRPSPGSGGDERAMGLGPEPPQPRSRVPAVAGPSGGAAPAHGPDLSPRPPSGFPAVPPRHPPRHCGRPAPFLGLAGPPHPTPAGSRQPRLRRGRRPLPSFPRAVSEAAVLQTLVPFGIPQTRLLSVPRPSPRALGKCGRVLSPRSPAAHLSPGGNAAPPQSPA